MGVRDEWRPASGARAEELMAAADALMSIIGTGAYVDWHTSRRLSEAVARAKEPPTPEEERRRELEERVLIDVCKGALRMADCHDRVHPESPFLSSPPWPEGTMDIIREWAAKGGGT
jgi:hypothetical protein